MTNSNERSYADLERVKLSLLGMAVSHSLNNTHTDIANGISSNIFDTCAMHLDTLKESSHVPDGDKMLVEQLIEHYKLALSETPQKQLSTKHGAMLDAFMLMIGRLVRGFAKSVQLEASEFIDTDVEGVENPYHITVVRFEFTDEVWQVAAVNADPEVPTDTYVNNVKLGQLDDSNHWVQAILKGIVVSMAVDTANKAKKEMALSMPVVAAKAQAMADIIGIDMDDCLTMALEFNYISETEDVGYPVTRGSLVQFIKMDLGCTLEQAYKAVQVWFDGNNEEIRA